jgi:hypothetical protein
MQQSSSPPAESLLNLLLDRYEEPRARLRDITQRIDYTQVAGPAAQDEFHRVLQEAEQAGGVALERERMGRFTGEYARVRLINAHCLYDFLVRTPAGTVADAAQRTIETSIPDVLSDPFFKDIEGEALDLWKANKTFLGLAVQQTETFVTILKLAYGIVHLTGRDIDHRTFSRRAVKDSKALERWEIRVAQLLKRRNPGLPGEEPREVLEASGIVRRAHLLQVKGPVRLVSDTLKIDGTGDVFIGLPWAAVQCATLARAVEYVITIENPTSFWRHCTEVTGNYLALLTDGFPARDVLSGMTHLVKVARQAAAVPLYHWGDIDAGGIRIAAHLEDAFGAPIALHQMSIGLAAEFGTQLQSRKGLDRLAERAGGIGELARWLCTDQAKALEQEELDPKAPQSTGPAKQ